MRQSRTILVAVFHVLCASIVAFTASTATAQSFPLSNIAVLDLQLSGGVSQEYQRIFTDRLAQELYETEVFRVMERAKMEEILEEQNHRIGDTRVVVDRTWIKASGYLPRLSG